MEVRKIQKTGGSTLVVSLPKIWCQLLRNLIRGSGGGSIYSISKRLIGERRELGWTVMPRYRKPKCGEADRTKAHMPTVGFRPPCRLDRHRGGSHLPTPAPTVQTGPYTAVREVTPSLTEVRRKTERFEISATRFLLFVPSLLVQVRSPGGDY